MQMPSLLIFVALYEIRCVKNQKIKTHFSEFLFVPSELSVTVSLLCAMNSVQSTLPRTWAVDDVNIKLIFTPTRKMGRIFTAIVFSALVCVTSRATRTFQTCLDVDSINQGQRDRLVRTQ